MTVSGELIFFLILALMGIMGGVLLLNLTRVVHMVVALLFTFLSIAGIFVLLTAEFVAIAQVLIYAGSITIIMLFGIMLTKEKGEDIAKPKVGRLRKILTFLGGVAFGAVIYFGIYNLNFHPEPVALHEDNTGQIGQALYAKYVIPFELASVVLLAALIGAIILAKKDDEEEADEK